jgi:thioredoxin-related protein
MRHLSYFLLLIPFLAQTQVIKTSYKEENDTGIQWTNGLSWEQIKEKAKNENKLIFVDAYATWCGPCKLMDKDVYPDKHVGDVLNQQFLSVRVQMDQTANDDEQVKSWYSVAQEFNQQYSIGGYPSFLFFNSGGKLVHKALGFKDVSTFIQLAKDALMDPDARYKKIVEIFKAGHLEYASMPDLAREARKRKDKQTALDIAKEFKQNYLDKLSDQEAFKPENLSFMADFALDLMKSNDRYFQLLYTKPVLADSIMKHERSRVVAEKIIRKEEIIDKIYKDDKPMMSLKPNWKRYQNSIQRKYGERYINKFFPDDQITFYAMTKDWNNYIKYVNKKIEIFPPKVNGKAFGPLFGDAWTLNSNAWILFLYCSDKKLLAKALPWADLAINLGASSYNADYIDTKANLLYRMNKVKEAIELEEDAVIRSNSNKGIVEALKKMKKNEPTWTDNSIELFFWLAVLLLIHQKRKN